MAGRIWERLGDVPNYVEPFFGSGAVLLGRPNEPHVETVNDLNAWLANFWRAVRADPEAVAYHADYPVSELDLHARGKWLFYRGDYAEFVEKVRDDPDYYCAKSAGWWAWGQSCWIGSGWGRKDGDDSTPIQRPHLKGGAGLVVRREETHKSRPHLKRNQGISRERVSESLLNYILSLSERTKFVRVCCGDWKRVVNDSVHDGHSLTGWVLDPPYGHLGRVDCYANESRTVARECLEWCLTAGENPSYRIALCGYAGEHEALEDKGWSVEAWKAPGGMANTRQGDEINENGALERIWYSPACIDPTPGLFG